MNLRKTVFVFLLLALLMPASSQAQWGGSPDDWGPDCCGGSTPITPEPERPERPERPKIKCRMSADKTTVTQGESVNLTVTSSASSATLTKRDGWRYFLGIFKVFNYTLIGNIPTGTPYTITPTETTTYRATVSRPGYKPGSCGIKINVTDNPSPPPTTDPYCTISANPSSVESGESTILTWSSGNATEAIIDNSIGAVGTAGSYSVGNITSDTTYTMTVSDADGSTSTCGTSVYIIDPPGHQYPICNVWVTPDSVTYGGQITLNWSSNNASSMNIPSIGSLTPNTSGSRIFSGLTADRSFECRAYDADGHMDIDTARVTVDRYATAPTCSLFASPINITTGGDSTLSWNTSNATSVTLSGMGSAPLSGTKVVYNLQNTSTYTLTANGPGGTAICSRTISVSSPPVQPPVPRVRPSCQIYPAYINRDVTSGGGGAILSWTAQNASIATLTDHGNVNPVTGTQFVKPVQTKLYTLTVFNDGYRASCSTKITVDDYTITDYTPSGSVNLTSVPYTGAEDYAGPVFLLLILLTLGFLTFFYRHHIWRAIAPER